MSVPPWPHKFKRPFWGHPDTGQGNVRRERDIYMALMNSSSNLLPVSRVLVIQLQLHKRIACHKQDRTDLFSNIWEPLKEVVSIYNQCLGLEKEMEKGIFKLFPHLNECGLEIKHTSKKEVLSLTRRSFQRHDKFQTFFGVCPWHCFLRKNTT